MPELRTPVVPSRDSGPLPSISGSGSLILSFVYDSFLVTM